MSKKTEKGVDELIDYLEQGEEHEESKQLYYEGLALGLALGILGNYIVTFLYDEWIRTLSLKCRIAIGIIVLILLILSVYAITRNLKQIKQNRRTLTNLGDLVRNIKEYHKRK